MVKKIIAALTLLIVFFLIGRAQKNPSSDPVFGLLPEKAPVRSSQKSNKAPPAPATVPPRSASHPAASSSVPLAQEILLFQQGQGGALFSYLFDGEFQRRKITPEILKAVEHRFAKDYPQGRAGHLSLGDREAINRIGILKAFGKQAQQVADHKLRRDLVHFYEHVLKSPQETLMVKREALRSLSQTQGHSSEKEYFQKLAQRDRHVLSLSAMSDRDIIEAVLEK